MLIFFSNFSICAAAEVRTRSGVLNLWFQRVLDSLKLQVIFYVYMYNLSRERGFIKFSKGSGTLKTLRIIVLKAKWHDREEESLNNDFLDDCYVPTIGLMGIYYRHPEDKDLDSFIHFFIPTVWNSAWQIFSILEVNFC